MTAEQFLYDMSQIGLTFEPSHISIEEGFLGEDLVEVFGSVTFKLGTISGLWATTEGEIDTNRDGIAFHIANNSNYSVDSGSYFGAGCDGAFNITTIDVPVGYIKIGISLSLTYSES